jgi:hypothetical protein
VGAFAATPTIGSWALFPTTDPNVQMKAFGEPRAGLAAMSTAWAAPGATAVENDIAIM